MADDENPYDDFLKSLAKMVEDIMNDMPDEEHARFIGCTIIAGGIPGTRHSSRAWKATTGRSSMKSSNPMNGYILPPNYHPT